MDGKGDHDDKQALRKKSSQYAAKSGVQIEDAIKQVVNPKGNEPVSKIYTRSSNTTPSSSTAANSIPSKINTVTTFTKMANLFVDIAPQPTTSTYP